MNPYMSFCYTKAPQTAVRVAKRHVQLNKTAVQVHIGSPCHSFAVSIGSLPHRLLSVRLCGFVPIHFCAAISIGS